MTKYPNLSVKHFPCRAREGDNEDSLEQITERNLFVQQDNTLLSPLCSSLSPNLFLFFCASAFSSSSSFLFQFHPCLCPCPFPHFPLQPSQTLIPLSLYLPKSSLSSPNPFFFPFPTLSLSPSEHRPSSPRFSASLLKRKRRRRRRRTIGCRSCRRSRSLSTPTAYPALRPGSEAWASARARTIGRSGWFTSPIGRPTSPLMSLISA